MKSKFKLILMCVLFLLGVVYIIVSIRKSAPPKTSAQPPEFQTAPARIYGLVEPEGGSVYVTTPTTRQIVEVCVKEGDTVTVGQKLCVLENGVEKAQCASDLAKVELARKAWDISKDEYTRNSALYLTNSITEFEYKQSKLRAEFDSLNLVSAQKQAQLSQAKLDQFDLKSPIDGRVYKFDIHLGESLPQSDNSFIILGKTGFWARLFVESFWIGRVDVGDIYQVKDSETNEMLGTGVVISKSPYLSGKVFRSNDPYERFDIKYQEVILHLQSFKKNIPIGLSVLAEIEKDGSK